MKVIRKIFNSKASALQAGCKESDLTIENGVCYCVCSTVNKKEAKAIKTTKEFKPEGVLHTKEEKITNKTE